MTLVLTVLLVVLGVCWAVLPAAVIIVLLRVARKETQSLEEAMDRHPAGSRADGVPWWAHVACCGGRVYGDTLEDLLVNQEFHERLCPHVHRKKAA
jgi:hypothetical protein